MIHEAGYPINLHMSLSDDKGMTIYSSGGGGQSVHLTHLRSEVSA